MPIPFNSGNVPPNPFTGIESPNPLDRQMIQDEANKFRNPNLTGEIMATSDPASGAPILVDQLTYVTLEAEYPEFMANRSAARLEDQNTVMSMQSLGLEPDSNAAVDGRLRATYRYATNSWLDRYDFLDPFDKNMFIADTTSDEQFEDEVLRLTDNGFGSYFLMGGSRQVNEAQDIPVTEVAMMNIEMSERDQFGLASVASPQAIMASYTMLYGHNESTQKLVRAAEAGDEEALVKMRDVVSQHVLDYGERDDVVYDRIVALAGDNEELQAHVNYMESLYEWREEGTGNRNLADRALLRSNAQASVTRKFRNIIRSAPYDFLNPNKTDEERTDALRLIKLGAKVYGPDYVQQVFTGVRESGFTLETAWENLDAPTAQMLQHLGMDLETFRARGFDPQNTVTFTYLVQQAMNQEIGSRERTARIERDYQWASTQMIARLGYDFYRGVADDPVARAEILPGILSGITVGGLAAKVGLGYIGSTAVGALHGGGEAFGQGANTSLAAQEVQRTQGLRTEISIGQMLQDALFIAGMSAGLEVVFAGAGTAIAKSFEGGSAVSGMAARAGVFGEETKENALARELARTMSNDDIAGLRIVAPNLTDRQRLRLQSTEVNAVDQVRTAIEAKVEDADALDTVGDLLSPSVLEAQGVSQLEAANFVQGVLMDLPAEMKMSSRELGELWGEYMAFRKESLGDTAGKTRPERLKDEIMFGTREDAENHLVSNKVFTPANRQQVEQADAVARSLMAGEEVKPKAVDNMFRTVARINDARVMNQFRDMFDSAEFRGVVGDDIADRAIGRMDEIVEISAKAREEDPLLDKAVRVAAYLEKADLDNSIQVKSFKGMTKRELTKFINSYIRTAGNKEARAALVREYGEARVNKLINDVFGDVEDMFERVGPQTANLAAFKKTDAYAKRRDMLAARKRFGKRARDITRKTDSDTDRAVALDKSQKEYYKSLRKAGIEKKSAKAQAQAARDNIAEIIENDFDMATPNQRREMLALGFTKLINRVDPGNVSNAPVADDMKQMNRLFAGTGLGNKLASSWSRIALWPQTQSKLFRSRTRIVRGMANFVGNRHLGTTRYGDVTAGTVEGAANSAKRQAAPVIGALRAIRGKMSREAYGGFQSAVMKYRMVGDMERLRKGDLSALEELPQAVRAAYKGNDQDLVDDLLAVDDLITRYNRQVLEEARMNGMMRLNPDGSPQMKIDPTRYVPNNLNSNLSVTKQNELIDQIVEKERQKAMQANAKLNTDVLAGLGWIRPISESVNIDPNTGKPMAAVKYEVPEESPFYGITGKGAEADAEFVLSNIGRGREWLEEMQQATASRRAAESADGPPAAAHKPNYGSKKKPRPTTARQSAKAANTSYYVTGFDEELAHLQRKAHAMREMDMDSMTGIELVRHLREYEDVMQAMMERQRELAVDYARATMRENGTPVNRADMSLSDAERIAKNDEAFAMLSPGHKEMLGRLDTLVANGTITESHKRMVMAAFARLDMNRSVGLTMHTRSPLDMRLRQLWNLEHKKFKHREKFGESTDRVEVVREADDSVIEDPRVLDDMDAEDSTLGTAFAEQGPVRDYSGGMIDIHPDIRDSNICAAATIIHEVTHVAFYNADASIQAAAQAMFNDLRKQGVNGSVGRFLAANGMDEDTIRYAMSNVHEFVAHLSEIVLTEGKIKVASEEGMSFMQGIMRTLKDLISRLFFGNDMDRMAGKAGFTIEEWKNVKSLIRSVYGTLDEQERVADRIRYTYTRHGDLDELVERTDIDQPGDWRKMTNKLDENDWREEVLRAVRNADPDFNDMDFDAQEAMLQAYYKDKGLVKQLFDIDPPAKEKEGLPVFEIDPTLARPDYDNLDMSVRNLEDQITRFEEMRLEFLQDEDGNPRVLNEAEEAEYRQAEEALDALKERHARDQFTLSTMDMSDEGYQRLLYIIDHTKGNITESYLKNIIRNDGVHIPTTGGKAGVPTESLNEIVKKAKLDYKQATKQQAEKMGGTGGGTADAPSASDLALEEATGDISGDIVSMNSAEGVSELAHTVEYIAERIRGSLSDAERADLDAGIVMLEVLAEAHQRGLPIGSTVLNEFAYKPDAAATKRVKRAAKDDDGNPILDENGKQTYIYVDEPLGQDAMKKLVKENSLHPYVWSKWPKEVQEEFKKAYKGFLKATQLKSPKPTLDKMFAIIKREANTEDLAEHFGEIYRARKEDAGDLRPENQPEMENIVDDVDSKFVEAAEEAVEAKVELDEVKNTDARSDEQKLEDAQDEIIAENPVVESATAANAAGEEGMVAPGYPVAIAELLESAKQAGSVQELKDNLDVLAVGDARNDVIALNTATLLWHAGEWTGDTPMRPGTHFGSMTQALDRGAVYDMDLAKAVDIIGRFGGGRNRQGKTTMTAAILPEGTRLIRVNDTGIHESAVDFILETLGNHPGLRKIAEEKGFDHDFMMSRLIKQMETGPDTYVPAPQQFEMLGNILRNEYGVDGLVYRNEAEGRLVAGTDPGDGTQGRLANLPNDSVIVLDPFLIKQRATVSATEFPGLNAMYRAGMDIADADDVRFDFKDHEIEWWTPLSDAELEAQRVPVLDESAPASKSKYEFELDEEASDADTAVYRFKAADGTDMELTLAYSPTWDGESALDVSFKTYVEDRVTTYTDKTGAGDVRNMLSAIFTKAVQEADDRGLDNLMFSRTLGDGDRVYGKMLERHVKGLGWHVSRIDVDPEMEGVRGTVEWVVTRGESDAEPQIVRQEPYNVEDLMGSLQRTITAIDAGFPIIDQVVDGLMKEARRVATMFGGGAPQARELSDLMEQLRQSAAKSREAEPDFPTTREQADMEPAARTALEEAEDTPAQVRADDEAAMEAATQRALEEADDAPATGTTATAPEPEDIMAGLDDNNVAAIGLLIGNIQSADISDLKKMRLMAALKRALDSGDEETMSSFIKNNFTVEGAEFKSLATDALAMFDALKRQVKSNADAPAKPDADAPAPRAGDAPAKPDAEAPAPRAGDAGGEEPPAPPKAPAGAGDADKPFGPDPLPEVEAAGKLVKKLNKRYADGALDELMNSGRDPAKNVGKNGLNPNYKGNLADQYDEGVNGIGTTDQAGKSIDPLRERAKQYVNTNMNDMQAVRASGAEGVDVDILIGRMSGGIDETMSRHFADEDFEDEIGREIAGIFADNMDLAGNIINYAQGTGTRVKVQSLLKEAFGKNMSMAKLFKEMHDSLMEMIQTEAKDGKLTGPKTRALKEEAEAAVKEMKHLFLQTIGMPIKQLQHSQGIGRATRVGKNLAYSKLGGTFSQMVALVEAPFAILRTGGMGPVQILRNLMNFIGGIFMAGAGMIGRNVPGMGRLASDYGIDRDSARFLSEDMVTFMDNFDGSNALSRFGFSGDQGNLAAFNAKDRVLAQANRVKETVTERGEDESWLGAAVEGSTNAIADLTGALSGMEQVTDIARGIGMNIGRTSLMKYGDKLLALAKGGPYASNKELIAAARKMGVPRGVAMRAGHAGLLENGGHALNMLKRQGLRFGRGSYGKDFNMNRINANLQDSHAEIRGQGFVNEATQEQIARDNQAMESLQEYILGFGRTASPELRGSQAIHRNDPISQFLFSMLSYPMAAYQELVSNGMKYNGIAATAGSLALLSAFEFNARMVRAMNDGTEEERAEAKQAWMDAMTGNLTQRQYLHVLANYGTMSPFFGHFGGYMGDAMNIGIDALAPKTVRGEDEFRKAFAQQPFASPASGTVQSIYGGIRGGLGAIADQSQPTTRQQLERRQNRLAKGLATAVDTFTPLNSGPIQALSQLTTGYKLGDAIGTAAFVGDRGFSYNAPGATPAGMWEGRSNRGYNQVIQYNNPSQAPDFQKRLKNAMERRAAGPPQPWQSEAEREQASQQAAPAAQAPQSAPTSASGGLADRLSDR